MHVIMLILHGFAQFSDPDQREIIMKFKRLHLAQQQAERQALENLKARCRGNIGIKFCVLCLIISVIV